MYAPDSVRASKRRKIDNSINHTHLADSSIDRPTETSWNAANKVSANVYMRQSRVFSPRSKYAGEEQGVGAGVDKPQLASTAPDLDVKMNGRTRLYGRQRKTPQRYLVSDDGIATTALHSPGRSVKGISKGRGSVKGRMNDNADKDGSHNLGTEAISGVDAWHNEEPHTTLDPSNGLRDQPIPVPGHHQAGDIEHPTLSEREDPTACKDSRIAEQCSTMRQIVLEKLAGRRPLTLVGLEKETAKVRKLLEQTITAGESNSMLVMGARGTGKTTLINRVIKELREQHRELFYVVRLSGFVQTDDRIALREIWRQLGKEMEVDDEAQTKAYADTLSTLLAVLSHGPEQQEKDGGQAPKSIVFIMDEFDLFAGHSRQTLLYNLFDIAQSRKAPIVVVGLTTRMDIMESMEKRVKSRFSHRYVLLNLPSTYARFEEICRSAVTLEIEDHVSASQASRSVIRQGRAVQPGLGGSVPGLDEDVIRGWNECSERLLRDKAVHRGLLRIFHTSKSVPAGLAMLVMPAQLLDPWGAQTIDVDAQPRAEDMLLPPDSKLQLLRSLPSLTLALLIAAARLEVSLDSDACNFNMVYDEYSNLAARARVMGPPTSAGGGGMRARVWSREVAKCAWEQLVDLELVLPTAGGSGHGSGDMARCDVALEEIAESVPEMEKQLEQWCRGL